MLVKRKKVGKKQSKYESPILVNKGNIRVQFRNEGDWLDNSLLLATDKKEDGEGAG